jgi:hypothetical protein
VNRYFEIEMHWILKQVGCLVLAISPVVVADCPETMKSSLSDPCIKDEDASSPRYGFLGRLQLAELWQLDIGRVHPPIRLFHLRIEQLVMESLWGLRTGESVIGDPRWGKDKRQPDIDAIAFLRNREKAMASRMVKK